MKLLVFSTVIPTKKNLRVNTFQTIHRSLKKRIPTELIWVINQPNRFEKIVIDDQTIYCVRTSSCGEEDSHKIQFFQ